jgi:hypothetical protein
MNYQKVWSFPSASPSSKYSSNRSTVRFQFRDFKAGCHAGSWASYHLHPVGSVPLSRLPRLAAPAGTLPVTTNRALPLRSLLQERHHHHQQLQSGLSLSERSVGGTTGIFCRGFTAFSNELPVPLSSGELEEVHLLRMVEV